MLIWFDEHLSPSTPLFSYVAQSLHQPTVMPVKGLWVPLVAMHNVYILPGVPQLFERMLWAQRDRFQQEKVCWVFCGMCGVCVCVSVYIYIYAC